MGLDEANARPLWDEAIKVLHAAGYSLTHVGPDQWEIKLGSGDVEGRIVREATLITLAETLRRVVRRPDWRW